VWEGSLGPDFFEEALYERFLVESKSDFTTERIRQMERRVAKIHAW
jgi:hypothetical protein